jgi:uncharacterized RDD family membrane protein YckC
MANENPFAPPVAEVADVAAAGPVLGGRGARLGAALIDGLLLLGMLLAINAVLPFGLLSQDESSGQLLINGVAGFALFLVVHGWLLVKHGQTVGKKLLGLRIVRTDGSLASPARVLGLRYGVGWLLSALPVLGGFYALIDSLFIFRASRQCLHDTIADTIVVAA